jgi:hypothetical protein
VAYLPGGESGLEIRTAFGLATDQATTDIDNLVVVAVAGVESALRSSSPAFPPRVERIIATKAQAPDAESVGLTLEARAHRRKTCDYQA